MIEGTLFIGLAIVGLTDLYRYLRDKKYEGAFTIIIAVLAGLVTALIDTNIGVQDITIAQGIVLGLSAVGVVTVAKKVG